MSLRLYLILMSIGTLFCWVTWGFVVFSISPTDADLSGFFFFYFSLFLAIVGTFSTMGFIIRRKIIKNDNVVLRHINRNFRQSILLATLIVLALFLLSKNLLTWWNALILLVLFFIIEGVIFSSRKYSNLDYVK